MPAFYPRLCLLLLLVFPAAQQLFAQCPPDLDVVWGSQTDITIYAFTYPNCTQLNSLTIGSTTANNIDDLSDLTNTALTTISQRLIVQNTELTSLTGLPADPSRRVTINNNDDLTSLNGLNESTARLITLTITGNDNLADCEVDVVCASVTNGLTNVTISGNGGDCATENDVLNACAPELGFLRALYTSLAGTNWDDDGGWSNPFDNDYCDWPYVTCNGDGRVTELRLKDDGLGGALPTSGWEVMDELLAFELESDGSIFNGVEGSIPAQLFELPKIEEVRFSSNRLSGAFPATISGATTLKIFYFSNSNQTSFTGTFPALTNLVNLEELTLNRMPGITGALPAGLSGLINLRLLEIEGLDQGGFTGGIPDLSALTALEEFTLTRHDNLTSWPTMAASLNNKPELTRLEINLDNLSGTLPATFSNLPKLDLVDLRLATMTGSLPVFSNSPRLEFYRVTLSPNLTVPTTIDIGGGAALRTLSISRNDFGGPLPVIDPKYSGLVSVFMNNNAFTGQLWETFPFPSVTSLDLGDNQLTGLLPEYFGDLNFGTFSVRLFLDNNRLAGCYPDNYDNLFRLSGSTFRPYATFSGNSALPDFEDFGRTGNPCRPTCSDDYYTLVELYFTNGGPDWTTQTGWQNIGSLSACDVSGYAGVTTNINDRVTALDLSGFGLSGELLPELSTLTELTDLDLSGNALEGCYPEDYDAFCTITTDFSGNAMLPDMGSASFFTSIFCAGIDACGGACPSGDVTLMSDATIATFVAAFSGCDVLTGDLELEGAAITDLSPLAYLEGIDGNFTVAEVDISQTLSFPNLMEVGGNLTVDDLANVNELTFASLTSVGGILDLTDLPQLKNLTGLANLSSVGGIKLDATGVSSLGGLSNLTGSIAGDLTLFNNTMLTDLGNLGGSGTASRGVALASVTSIGNLQMLGNNALTSLASLGDLTINGDLLLINNTGLTDCAVDPVCTQLNGTGNKTISGNGAGCTNTTEVEADCQALPVSWLDFTATQMGKRVELTWITADEADNAGYVVQRSPDGSRWDDLGFLRPVTAEASGAHHYDFDDAYPLNGTAYYRIQQQDFDGTLSYSSVVTVRFTSQVAGLVVVPNPNNGSFELRLDAALQTAELRDMNGRLLALDVDGQRVRVRQRPAAGVYLLTVVDVSGNRQTARVMIR